MGTKRKFWCEADDGRSYLFKYARVSTGENWSEKIAAEVAGVLGIPHAEVDLAICEGHPGTLTLAITDDQLTLTHGNELLQERRPEYPARVAYGASEHTVIRVLDALRQSFIHPPEGTISTVLATAVDWLDAQNESNPGAVALRSADKCLLGYIPDYLVTDVATLIAREVPMNVVVERVNLPPAPLHHRVLCRLEARWPDGFVPFQGERFQPIDPLSAPVAQATRAL